MAGLIAGAISLAMTLAYPRGDGWLMQWLGSYAFAFAIAYPLSLILPRFVAGVTVSILSYLHRERS